MKLLLPLAVAAPLCVALVTPQLLQDVFSDLKGDIESIQDSLQNIILDDALESSPNDNDQDKGTVSSWISSFFDHPIDDVKNLSKDIADLPPHRHPRVSDKTIYQLISESKYTTILAKIIDKDSELVDYLNSTKTNFTFFAPTDHAFAKIPHRHHRHHHHDDDDDGDDEHHLPKKFIHSLIKYHSSPDVLSAAEIFHSQTLSSSLADPLLGSSDTYEDGLPQRLTARSGFKGLVINFYSHVVAPDIGASNGIIHGIDSILLPPPPTLILLDIIPSKFSTFNLALYKTDLISALNTTSSTSGGTVFVPSNSAFERLGFRTNAFLFSPPGLKYLRALLKYHIVPNRTLYSDVLYTSEGEIKPFGTRGPIHIDLPTLLDKRSVAIDVTRFGPYTSFRINGHQRVAFADALTKDGNVHVLEHVLIPPKKIGDGQGQGEEELTVEELKARLRPWVDSDDYDDEEKDGEDGEYEVQGVRIMDL